MSEFSYKAGLNHVGSYQVSGIPYVTSSLIAPASSSNPLEIVFPSVTKTVVVKNVHPSSSALRIGFSANGIKNGTNYFVLQQNESFAADLKLTSIFLLSNNGTAVSASIMAGLTGISGYDLTTAYSGSSGVG